MNKRRVGSGFIRLSVVAGCPLARPEDDLLPMGDQASSALILDLELRGLLDEALVMVIRDHGRTPLTDRKDRGEAATTGRAPAPRSMPMASRAEATESVDSSTRL